uniref:Secreted protein n=1 Tax=Angiostrongylus cantonensis TaxID=6313 RepID=A0A0K0CY63_ANGCA
MVTSDKLRDLTVIFFYCVRLRAETHRHQGKKNVEACHIFMDVWFSYDHPETSHGRSKEAHPSKEFRKAEKKKEHYSPWIFKIEQLGLLND